MTLLKRTVRYDATQRRFFLSVAFKDDVMFDVKRIEGRRWHKDIRSWSTPASLRAWKQLQLLGFEMLAFGGGRQYVGNLIFPSAAPANKPDLFPFQQTGVAWMGERRYSLLADDPGLGKTYQAIEGLRGERSKIVISPKIVIDGWAKALEARQVGDPIHHRAPTAEQGWNLVNYEFLQKLNVPEGFEFDLIVDEAHLVTNIKARRTKLTLQLAERAKRVLLITGTPPSQPIRLWPLYLMLQERSAKEFFPWALRYTGAERNEFGWDFSGATHLDELLDDMQHFMLRRRKANVLADLPEKLFTTILAQDVAKPTVKALNALDTEILDLLSKGHTLTGGLGVGAAQRLRVLASKAKLPSTVEWVLAHGVPATKVLVFCEFRDSMEELATRFQAVSEHPLTVLQIHGDTSDRPAVIKQFQDDPTAGVCICQFTAAGAGTDGLQVASTVVIHDLPWTPDQFDQAIDRAHRIGQRDSVHAVTMLSGSRVERAMLEGLRAHRSLEAALYEGVALPAPAIP